MYLGQEREMLCLKWTLCIEWSFQVYWCARTLAPWGPGYSTVFISGWVVCKLKMQLQGEILQMDWGRPRTEPQCLHLGIGWLWWAEERRERWERQHFKKRPRWETLLWASWISGVGSQFELSVIQFGNAWDQKCFWPPILGCLCTHSGLLGTGLTSVRATCTRFFLCFFLSLLCCQMPLVRVLL